MESGIFRDGLQWQRWPAIGRRRDLLVLLLSMGFPVEYAPSHREISSAGAPTAGPQDPTGMNGRNIPVRETIFSELAVAPCMQRPVDLVFMVDGSERMGSTNFRHVRDFIEKVATTIPLAKSNSDALRARIAVVQYGSENEQQLVFGLSNNVTAILDSLATMSYLDSSSNVGSAIIYGIRNLVQRPGPASQAARRGAELSFVFITDGTSGNKSLGEAVDSMRKHDVVPTVIAVGPEVDMDILMLIGLGERAAIYRAADYSQILHSSFFERLYKWIC